jgi:hypothetical protein
MVVQPSISTTTLAKPIGPRPGLAMPQAFLRPEFAQRPLRHHDDAVLVSPESTSDPLRRMPLRLGGYANEVVEALNGSVLHAKHPLYLAGYGILYAYALADVVDKGLKAWRHESGKPRQERTRAVIGASLHAATFQAINSWWVPTGAVIAIKAIFKGMLSTSLRLAKQQLGASPQRAWQKSLIATLERMVAQKQILATVTAILALPVLSAPIDQAGVFAIALGQAIAKRLLRPQHEPNPFAPLLQGFSGQTLKAFVGQFETTEPHG